MTKRVNRKLFKNGGSMAIRIPKGWLPEDTELQLMLREDGVLEVSAVDRVEKLRRFEMRMIQAEPLSEDAIWLPDRGSSPDRWDWGELAGDWK